MTAWSATTERTRASLRSLQSGTASVGAPTCPRVLRDSWPTSAPDRPRLGARGSSRRGSIAPAALRKTAAQHFAARRVATPTQQMSRSSCPILADRRLPRTCAFLRQLPTKLTPRCNARGLANGIKERRASAACREARALRRSETFPSARDAAILRILTIAPGNQRHRGQGSPAPSWRSTRGTRAGRP
jgi:hypothetical protein